MDEVSESLFPYIDEGILTVPITKAIPVIFIIIILRLYLNKDYKCYYNIKFKLIIYQDVSCYYYGLSLTR